VINLFDDITARRRRDFHRRAIARGRSYRANRLDWTVYACGQPHRQGHDEWVLLLAGSAGLRIECEGDRNLRPGDHVFIAAHRAHWVTRTAKDKPTIWLAIHFS
jgi:quercetin dioxygenase-like cupin family protein